MSTFIRKPRGFTIVEMLVVIGIIALLLGMLLPALASAKRRAAKSEEMNYLRQVGIAWNLYGNANNDAALPGHLSPGVQDKWRVSYKFFNGEKVPPGNNPQNVTPPEPFDVHNEDNIAGPWTYRLLPYLEHNHEVVHGYTNEPEADDLDLMGLDEAKEVSQHPSFGYNGYHIGGVWHLDTVRVSGGDPIEVAVPRFNWSTATGYHGDVGPASVISKSISSISRSTEVVIFCSAAPLDRGIVTQIPADVEGGHLVHPPYLARERQWGPSTGFNEGGGGGPGGPGGTNNGFGGGGGGNGGGIGSASGGNKFEVFQDNCTVPIGRYGNLAVTIYADFHIEQIQPLSLFDQRMWINSAKDQIWVYTEGNSP